MGVEDGDKITRSSGDTLAIKLTEDEETYRAKYLPDPKKLTDEKLVCTVCSVSLAREIHQGKTVQVHRALKVLVCEACFTFYGDGCFSADEDGDDKYCRWCGQGGTLFLCSTCNCAFCQKCVKQNLKASVLADLEKDDWKCYFCNPRPLFGCRTICWGALELNKIGMEKEKEKLKKQRERLEKMEARKREKEEHLQKLKKLDMSSEDEQSTKKRKSRVRNSDSSSSEVMPAKKTRSSEGRGHVNGNIDRSRRKRRDSSSDEDDSDNKKVTSKLRSRNKRTKKPADSSSEDESDVRSKSKGKLKKKPSKDNSDWSDEDTKSKRKPEKKRNDSSDDESSDEKHVKKKRMTRRKKNDSESSSDHKPKKKNLRRKKKDSSAEDKSNDDPSKKQTKAKKKPQAEDSSDNSEDNSKRDRKKLSESKKRNDDSDDDSKKSRKHVNDKCVVDGKAEELKLKGNDASVDNALVRKRIKLAVLWLSSAVKDISELGTLISIRATKFGKKKINLENLKTYDDVLNAVSKLKQLMSGIHSNYEHLEKGLEAQLKPWKMLTGLEEPDKEKITIEETNTTAKSEVVVKEVKTSEIFEQSTVEEVNLKSEKNKENTATDDMVLQWSGLSADEDSSEEKMATRALISKAKDTLDKEDITNGETETTKNDFSKEKVIDQSKNQDITADDVSMSPSKNPTNIDDTANSESLLNQSENGLKDDSQTLVETSEKEDEKEALDMSNISKKTDASHSGSDTDMFDASEIISSTQVNNGEDDECSGDESKQEKRKDSPESASKRKSELKASVDACLRRPRIRLHKLDQSSDNEFDSFSKKLQNKWLPEDNMNLKTSLGIDSSGDSDVESEKNKDKEKNIVLKNDSCKEKRKKGNVKCSEKMIGKSKDSDAKLTSGNSESKVKDAPEEEKPDRPKRTMKVNENNKNEVGKNDKTEKLDRNNVLTSDEESEHEDIEKDEDKFAKSKRNKKDSTTKKQKNKFGDKSKTNKKDRHSSESDDTEENKNGKMDENKNNGPLNKKNKEDIKKQSKKETQERKIKLSSDESEDEDMKKDSNSKTQRKRNKQSTTNHKKDKNSYESDDTKGTDDKVKEVKKRCSQNKKNKDEIKKEIKDKKNTLSSEDSEDENIKNNSNSINHQSKRNIKSSINHEKDKHSSESDYTEGDKQDKAKEDNLKGSVNTKNKVETNKQSKEETQERKNILSSDDSGDEDMKKDKSTINKKKDINSSESGDIEGENNDKVKEDKKKGSQNKKTKVEVKKQSKKETQERKNTLSSDDSGDEDMKKDSKTSTIDKKKDRNSSVSDDAEGKNNDKVKDGKKKGSQNKKTKDEVKKQSKKETQERKNTLSSDDSGDEDMKKDSNSTIHQSNRNKKDNKNRKKDRNSSLSDDAEGENNDKVKEGKKKGSQNRKNKDEVKKQSKKETQERKNTLSSDDSGDEDLKKDSNTINQSNRNKKDKKNRRNSSHSEDSEKYEKSNTNKRDEQSITKEKSKNKLDESKGNDSLDESLDVDTEAKNKSNKSNTSRESSEEKEIRTDSQNKSLCKKSKEKSNVIEDCDISDLAKDEFQDTNLSEECVQLEDDDEICQVSVEESSKAMEDKKTKEKPVKKKSERNKRQKKNLALLDSSDEEDLAANDANSPQQENSDVEEIEAKEDSVRSVSLIDLSSDDSSDFEVIKKRKRKPKSSSDSEPIEVSEDEDKKSTKKRKRIKIADSSSDEESGSDEGNVRVKRKRKSSVGESPGKGGRKNIKKIKGKDDLADATKEAAEEEKERRRRVEERQQLFNQVFEVKEAHVLDKLVLDFDPKEKKELLSVNKALVSKMKPHQAKGVKFMWDSCFETLSEVKNKKGSGCILAHCMGLGKTFQVISLVHTLITNNEETGIHTVMVVCPLSTVLNWYNEFDKWLQGVEGGDDIEVFHLTKCKQNPERARELRRWQHNGGVLIMGYEMFRNLSAENKKFRGKIKKDFQETLIDPGADLIVCDEGHMLKNEQTALSKAMTKVRTLRRIILTGTPMQNNLNEYHCMVQFVKPNLLGTRKEFLNRFVNPITNGQFVDSTDSDVKVMKRRAHVLHKMLEGLVQRFDYNVLTPFLPPKHEYVVSVCLSELQIKLYQHYLQNYSQQSENNKGGAKLFQDWQALGRIWTHPRVLKMSSEKANWLREKKAMEESDSEGSLKDFIDDGSDAETTAESSDDNSSFASDKSDSPKKSKSHSRGRMSTRKTRSNKNIALLDSSEDEKEKKEEEATEAATANDGEWWSEFVEPNHLDDINQSGKLVLLLGILKECEMIEDKILVFSQSLFSLDLIEYFLDKIDQATQDGRLEESLGNHQGNWSKGLDYFRLDGSTSSENRSIWCSNFNREDNPRARLFLISTRAGGLGINLTAANRVIIFDASWNPSHDVQSIFRIYRFGQKKPCYVYRFIAHGTMEEKVYDRQVAKQSMSNRVVDEQQVHRHFSHNDLNELYSFTPPTNKEDREIPSLPKDVLFAEILKAYSDWIEKFHEHDSLLENVIEEELNEEERKLAWEDYENDKKRGFAPPNTGNAGMSNTMSYQIEYLRQQLKVQYPNKSEQELNQILVYQVSLLMRQQQMKTQMQQQQPGMNMGMAGNMAMQMGQSSMMAYANQLQQQGLPQAQQQQMYADYQKKLQQANMARLQLQQLQYQQQQQQQSVLRSQLTQPAQQPGSVAPSLPQSRAIETMLQNYQALRAQGPQDTSKSKPSKPPS